MTNPFSEHKEDTLVEDEIETKEPSMYKVILLNDNYTTMDFVVLVLEQIFKKMPAEAQQIMLNVHEQGAGLAGIYTKDVAETKVALVHKFARDREFPLKCTMEAV
ncbi:MAG: ATP-dependent Clp protease adapter ClpS [Deltaproteobacteria bacterium]|nr:ATP-dependent Clp protease adapter ClpS [Deltaproteobacteria bacterium]